MTTTPSEPGHPLLLAAHAKENSPDLLLQLKAAWGAPKTTRGDPIPADVLRRDVEDRLARHKLHGIDLDVGLVPPPLPSDARREAPVYALSLDAPTGVWATEGEPAVSVDIVVASKGPRCAGLFSPTDARTPQETARFLDACRHVVSTLESTFAGGDSWDAFAGPGPRRLEDRIWGATYLGPDTVDELGWPHLHGAPAYLVERTPEGGAWVLLDALPFRPSPAKEARRVAVERHLGFPGAPGEEGPPPKT